MPVACTLTETKKIILKADLDLPVDEQTEFELRPLPAKWRKRCLSLLASDPGTGLYELVRFGVKGWSNFKNKQNDEIKPMLKREDDEQVLSESSMSAIGPYWIELAAEVVRFNNLEDDERGNSPSSPKSPQVA